MENEVREEVRQNEPEREPEAGFQASLDELRREIAEMKAALAGRYAAANGIDAGAGLDQGPRLTREALHRMSPSEIARLDWNEVSRVLRTR